MITLYVKTGCPFCATVLEVMDKYDVKFEEKNIAEDGVADELIEIGGKRQTPFMYVTDDNTDDDVKMYESDDIVKYIEKKFGNNDGEEKATFRVHKSENTMTCPPDLE